MINLSFPNFFNANLPLKKPAGTLTFQFDTAPILDLAASFDRKLSDSIANAWDLKGNRKSGYREPIDLDRVVVFGDSLSDPGNLFKLTGGLVPPSLPYSNGRFSNGDIWIDYFAKENGLDSPSIANFAVGGAKSGLENISTTLFGLPASLNLPGVLTEVNAFASQPTFVSDPNTLYVLWGSNNDLLNLPRDPQGALKGIFDTVFNIARSVRVLAQLGAENILIPNSVNLGLTPFTQSNGTSQLATTASIVFNRLLDRTVPILERGLGVNIIEVDLFKLSQQVAANPGKFGFTNITDPLISTPNPVNPAGYVWWDQVHPTTQFHQLVAKTFETAVEKSFNRSSTLLTSDRWRGTAKSALEDLLPTSSSSWQNSPLKV
jgi:outer membrane lipase/esterase